MKATVAARLPLLRGEVGAHDFDFKTVLVRRVGVEVVPHRSGKRNPLE